MRPYRSEKELSAVYTWLPMFQPFERPHLARPAVSPDYRLPQQHVMRERDDTTASCAARDSRAAQSRGRANAACASRMRHGGKDECHLRRYRGLTCMLLPAARHAGDALDRAQQQRVHCSRPRGGTRNTRHMMHRWRGADFFFFFTSCIALPGTGSLRSAYFLPATIKRAVWWVYTLCPGAPGESNPVRLGCQRNSLRGSLSERSAILLYPQLRRLYLVDIKE